MPCVPDDPSHSPYPSPPWRPDARIQLGLNHNSIGDAGTTEIANMLSINRALSKVTERAHPDL